MCKVLKISESGYYKWLKNRSKPTKQQLLLVEINVILAQHKDNDNYGVRRLCIAWHHKGGYRGSGAGKSDRARFPCGRVAEEVINGYYGGSLHGRKALCFANHGLFQWGDRGVGKVR